MRELNPTALSLRMRVYACAHELPEHHPLYRAADMLDYAASKPDHPSLVRRVWLHARAVFQECEMRSRADRRL